MCVCEKENEGEKAPWHYLPKVQMENRRQSTIIKESQGASIIAARCLPSTILFEGLLFGKLMGTDPPSITSPHNTTHMELNCTHTYSYTYINDNMTYHFSKRLLSYFSLDLKKLILEVFKGPLITQVWKENDFECKVYLPMYHTDTYIAVCLVMSPPSIHIFLIY